MLKGISPMLSPLLLKVLCEMGHSDQIVLADGNFPVKTMGKDAVIIDMQGIKIPELLDAILPLFPLDTYVEHPITLMKSGEDELDYMPIWKKYESIIKEHQEGSIEYLERFAFYEKAKQAYAIIATTEASLYANMILQKGTISE